MRAWTSNPVHDQNGHIRHLLEWLVDLDHHPAPSDGPLRRGLVESVVREGLRLQHAPHSQLVQSVSRFVRENLADKLALEDLARYAHMSKYYFSRRFRKECGRSPMQYVAEMRIQAAKQMLLRTDMTIAAIAVAVGLRDGPHFSHVFKRYTGYTPGAFRANR
jgi:transcriptional regulator GlxA family with amidase domain